MFLVVSDRVREAPTGGRCRLEALIAPARIQIQVADRSSANKWTTIWGHVLDSRPMAQQPQSRDRRNKRHGAFGHALHLRKLAPLRVAVKAINVAAEHESPFVGLRDIKELSSKGDHMIHEWLNRRSEER